MKTKGISPAALGALASGDIENFVVASTPGGIEAQEKRGQEALVNPSNMPAQMWPSRVAFETVGFVFGDVIDRLFLKATLPPGWTREGTSHSMHSNILDAQGRRRVGIFYKAAFYDQRADASLVCRYKVETLYPQYAKDAGLKDGQVAVAVRDGGTVIHKLAPVGERDWDTQQRDCAEALRWLKERFPNFADPTAYWE